MIIAPVGTMARLVRSQKIVEILLETDRPLVHLAWEREDGDDAPVEGVERRVVLRGGGYQSDGLGPWYLRYALACRREMAASASRTNVYVLGLAGGIATLGIARRKINILFDNNDNLAMSMDLPAPIRAVARALEGMMVKRASVHLVPGISRWPKQDANLCIVPNVPSSGTLKGAVALAGEKGFHRSQQFTLYVNGWLTPTRGLASLASALKRIEAGQISILLAGRIERMDPDLGYVLSRPEVEFLGPVSSVEALALYARSHAVLTFYDPALEINRLAEPNKWGDSIVMGCPFICNCEIETSRPFIEAGAAFCVPYSDSAALASLLCRLAHDRREAEQAGEKIRLFGTEPWDVQMRRVVSRWLGY